MASSKEMLGMSSTEITSLSAVVLSPDKSFLTRMADKTWLALSLYLARNSSLASVSDLEAGRSVNSFLMTSVTSGASGSGAVSMAFLNWIVCSCTVGCVESSSEAAKRHFNARRYFPTGGLVYATCKYRRNTYFFE